MRMTEGRRQQIWAALWAQALIFAAMEAAGINPRDLVAPTYDELLTGRPRKEPAE